MKKLSNNEKGFTLIELAIVLVIIGIIIGAVLKGQDLIENARHKKFANTVKQFEVLAWGFMDRKGYFPGDSDKDGKISDDVKDDITSKGRFLDPPSTNSITLGSFTFYVFFGNDGTKNYIAINNQSAGAGTFTDASELAYLEAFDTSIDGSAEPTGRVFPSASTLTTTDASSKWLITGTPTSAASYAVTNKYLIYYFDRKP